MVAGGNDVDESFDVLRPAARFAAGKRWPFPSLDAQGMKDVGTRPCSVFGAPCRGSKACPAGSSSSEAHVGAATPAPLGSCGSHDPPQDGPQALAAQALAAQALASPHAAPTASSRPHEDQRRAEAEAHHTTPCKALEVAARGDGGPGMAAGGGSEREEAADSVSPEAARGGWAHEQHQQLAQGEDCCKDPILVYLPLVKNEVCSLRTSAFALLRSCYCAAYLGMLASLAPCNLFVCLMCAPLSVRMPCAHAARPCMLALVRVDANVALLCVRAFDCAH